MNKKISVTIPVYNVEPDYIENAINSVLNQTYKNIEIIVVNDGSTDEKTLEYLRTINNPVIKIINQENKGSGGARNTGIENSNGEYIGFLDADDWLDANFYEVLYNLCEENNADIACGTLTRKNIHFQKPMDSFDNKVVDNFLAKMKYISNGSVCSKLFKKDLFLGVRFKEHTYYEDNPVLVDLLVKSNKVAFTNTVKYYYRENFESITTDKVKIKNEKYRMDKLLVLQSICDIVSDMSQKEKDAVFSVFTPVLVDGDVYNTDKEYQNVIKNLLGKNYKKYLQQTKNSFMENIFSIKNTPAKTHKIVTILWVKFRIKRKSENHA